ncbi:MAG: sigma-70 family RNA polymerase sigma factor [Novosphingobium sp.]
MPDAPDPRSKVSAVDPFREGLVRLLPHLRAFARGLSGRSDQADDLVQDTILKAWSARQGFAQGTNLKAWTFTIMRNHFLNQLRKRRREIQLEEGGEQGVLVSRAEQEDRIHVSDLQRALDRLPAERREALLLVGAGGFSYEEAAQVCGVALGTMKSRVARGRKELAALLAAPDCAAEPDGRA